jgi:hypothetical protein
VYDVLTGEVVKQLAGHRALVRDVHWHPHQPMLLSASVSIIGLSWWRVNVLSNIFLRSGMEPSRSGAMTPKRTSYRLLP